MQLNELFFNYWSPIANSDVFQKAYDGVALDLASSNEELVRRYREHTLRFIADNPRPVVGNDISRKIADRFFTVNRDDPYFTALDQTDRARFVPFLEKPYYLLLLQEVFIDKMVAAGVLQQQDSLLRFHPYLGIGAQIGEGATCSAPYIAAMYGLLASLVKPKKIFEFGTGCAYQIAYYAAMFPEVELFGIDYHQSLCDLAQQNLQHLPEGTQSRIHIEQGNALNPPELFRKNAPYDVISAAFMMDDVKEIREWNEFLTEGGILIVPMKESENNMGWLGVFYKGATNITVTEVAPVSFMPVIRR